MLTCYLCLNLIRTLGTVALSNQWVGNHANQIQITSKSLFPGCLIPPLATESAFTQPRKTLFGDSVLQIIINVKFVGPEMQFSVLS